MKTSDKKYANLLLIYYSGTGNSKRVCEWMAEKASERGIRTHTVSYDKFDSSELQNFEGKTLIGFFSATHGFNMPHSMLNFLLHFRWLKGSDIFIGNTRAGMKLWKLFLLGLSGVALYLPALFMILKGYKLRSMYSVDLPSNWISLHPGLRKKVVDSIVDRCRRLSFAYIEKVLDGRRPFLKAFILLPLDALIAPVALGYYFIGRFLIAKSFIANDACNSCGLCAKQCPTQSILFIKDKPFWKFSCESCMHCMNYCPHRAIETAHSFVFLLLALMTWLINPLIGRSLTYLMHTAGQEQGIIYELLYFILKWGIMLLTFALGYCGLHYVMRFPSINRILSYTFFSRWNFWRRYHIPAERHSKSI